MYEICVSDRESKIKIISSVDSVRLRNVVSLHGNCRRTLKITTGRNLPDSTFWGPCTHFNKAIVTNDRWEVRMIDTQIASLPASVIGGWSHPGVENYCPH